VLKLIKKALYDRKVLIGRPNLTLKNFQCQNITCNKKDKFKKWKNGQFICECGYITKGNHEIEETHKVKFGCSSKCCPQGKKKMDTGCLRCEFIYEK
jgi:hypothetical protein